VAPSALRMGAQHTWQLLACGFLAATLPAPGAQSLHVSASSVSNTAIRSGVHVLKQMHLFAIFIRSSWLHVVFAEHNSPRLGAVKEFHPAKEHYARPSLRYQGRDLPHNIPSGYCTTTSPVELLLHLLGPRLANANKAQTGSELDIMVWSLLCLQRLDHLKINKYLCMLEHPCEHPGREKCPEQPDIRREKPCHAPMPSFDGGIGDSAGSDETLLAAL
jgi:hypothetical protein